jgi:hypothetical protein
MALRATTDRRWMGPCLETSYRYSLFPMIGYRDGHVIGEDGMAELLPVKSLAVIVAPSARLQAVRPERRSAPICRGGSA